MSAPAPSAARVLLLEDGEQLAALIRQHEPDFSVVAQPENAEQAVEQLGQPEAPDLVVAKLTADEAGASWVARLREAAPDATLVIFSQDMGSIDPERTGADEWLAPFPPEPALFRLAIRAAREKRRLIQACNRERDMLDALLEVVPARIYFKDEMSRFARVSRSLEVAARRERGELTGKSDFDIFLPDHAQEAFHDEREILRTGEPITQKQEKQMRPDGRVSWAETSKFPFRDGQGRLRGTFGISWDVTEIKRMEAELQRERNLLLSVLSNVPDSIFVKDSDGTYLLSNHAHTASLGKKSTKEVIGKTVYDFFETEVARRFSATDRKILQTGDAMIDIEEKASGPGGKDRWLLTTKVPLYNEEGEGILVCINRDITQRKQAELQLMELNSHLFAATADLKNANEELRTLQLQVIEAEKHKSVARLAAGVAHEVKNPLAVIIMGTEYLRNVKTEDEVVPDVVEQIAEAARRADVVVKGLLDFSAPRKIELQPCDLNEVIRRAAALLHGECVRASVSVEMALGEIPALKLDAAKISQVLINIMLNAIQAMEEPGRLIVSTCREQITGVGENVGGDKASAFLAGEDVVVVRLKDTGPGIPESHLQRIFDPFFTTKPTGKGTGLGMTVVKSIIDLHRGTIEINNCPEGGTIVTITLKTDS